MTTDASIINASSNSIVNCLHALLIQFVSSVLLLLLYDVDKLVYNVQAVFQRKREFSTFVYHYNGTKMNKLSV